MADYICDELIVEILSRVPSKSLLRFRLLSKSLCSIIFSPDFIRMHTFRSPQKFLFMHRDKSEQFYTLHSEDRLPLCPRRGYFDTTPVKFPYNKYSCIVGSCNGILCLVDTEKHISLWNPSIRLSLWNPSIRRKLTLPDCFHGFFSHVNIGFGFGFDPITDDYKIVIFGVSEENSFVYTLKTGAWCAIASPPPIYYKVISPLMGCVNGAFHWLVERGVDNCHILTFDLSTHVFGMIPLPQSSRKVIGLTTIQASLAVIAMDCDDSLILVRKDDSWSVVFKWKTNQVKGGLKGVLQLTCNGNLLFNTRIFQGFQTYNPKIRVHQSTPYCFDSACCSEHIAVCGESLQLLDIGRSI